MKGLKPCPFCKGKGRLVIKGRLETSYFSYYIRCSSCGVKSDCYPDYNREISKNHAFEWWNYNIEWILKKKLSKSKAMTIWKERSHQ